MSEHAKTYDEYWVCVDCYVEFHGMTEELADKTDAPLLKYLPPRDELIDAVCPNHGHDDSEYPQCEECLKDHDGHITFSKQRCEGCHSTLAGERFCLEAEEDLSETEYTADAQ